MLRDKITNALSNAFDNKLADAVTDFEGVRVTKGNYNPITGESDDLIVKYTGRGVFGSYALSLIDGESILSTDQKLTALQAEVTNTPQINDKIEDYTVINVAKDPANVTWSIQLRRK